MVHQYSPLEEKLKNYTEVNGCWEYNGKPNNYGYCPLMVDGKWSYAHRFAYEFYYGKIPKGMTVDHICFNRKCINPAHLRLLSAADNARRHKHSQEQRFCSVCGDEKVRTAEGGRLWCRRCARRRAAKHNARRHGTQTVSGGSAKPKK